MASRNQRLDATITIGSVIDKTFGRNINVLRKGLDSVGDEIKGITNRQRELSKQRRVLERQGKSVDELDREYEQLGRTLDDLRRKQERFERAQGAANRAARQFGEASRQVGRTVRNASIAIGAVSAASFGLASSTAAAGDEFAKQARALGFNVEAYQELQYAAERSGVSAETFNSSMTAFTKRLGEAADGSGPAKDALDQLGLSAEELVGLEPDVALAKVADAMKDVRDPARRAALASDLFSRSGIRMTNVLNEGSTGIQALRDRARELGLVLSEDATTDSETFQDSLLNAQSAMLGVKNVIGSELIPVIGDMMDSFTEFVVTNQPQIREFAETFATGFRDNLPLIKDTIIDIKDFALEIGKTVGTVAEFVGGWDNLVIGLAAAKFAPLVVSVAGLGVALGKAVWAAGALAAPSVLPVISSGIAAVGAAIAATPIGLLVAGAAAVAGGAYLIYQNWDGVKSFFSDLFGSVIDTLGGFGQFVGGIFTGDLTSAVDGIKLAWQGWSDTVTTIFNGVGATMTAVWTDLIKPVTDALGVTEPIVAAWGALQDGIGGVIDWMGEKFDWVLEKIRPVIEALSWVSDQGSAAVGAVTGFFGGDGEVSGGSASRTEARAIGGALSANIPTLVGERGPEIIYPNQGGFVAHNRALERMAAMSSMIGSTVNVDATPAGLPSFDMPAPAPLDLSGIVAPRQAQGGGAKVSNVTQQITINAPQSMDIPSLVAELKRLQQQAQNDALFDGATDWGQYA